MNPPQAEQLITIIKQAQLLKQQGSTEDSDPEYKRLLTMLRWYNQQSKGALQDKHLDTLKLQIQAFRLLSTNKMVPQSLLAQLDLPPVASQLAQIAPGVLPTLIDPQQLSQNRTQYMRNRVEYRIAELTAMESHSIQQTIELKALRLLPLQKQLRDSIMHSAKESSILRTCVDRSAYRQQKKQSLREARTTEKQERLLRNEKDLKERQKHIDYMNSIMAHGRDFMQCHRANTAKMAKWGQSVARFHQNAQKEEERRLSRMSQDRLNALKANDEEAYLKLLDQSKDTRITHLLSQTNSFLKTLTNGLEKQKATAGDVARTDDDDEPRDYYETAHKVKELVHEQPSILVGGTLKDYQVKGLQWMVSLYNNRLNGILADEMGLGKTIQTLSLITYLIEKKKQAGPFLVIVPLSTMTNWVNEFEKWAPSVLKIVYKGSPNERRMLSAQVRQGNYNVLLTTYEYIINPKDRPTLCRIKWVHIIIDEGHRLKNANSRLSITLMQYYSARYRLILTGTPLQNNLPELWALLNFILPKIFNSVKSFDEWFNTPFATATGQERIDLNEEEQLLIIRRLHKVLRPFLLRRLKKDVESELPDKVETIIKCPLSSLQSKLYEQIRSRRMGEGFQK